MGLETGILFAFLALIFWGFGDFLIQKSTRKFGDWETLFIISIFGTIILSPFIYKDLVSLFSFNKEFWILLGVSAIILFAAILDFEALKKGKLAIIEPVLALEVPVSVVLAVIIIKENLSLINLILISLIVIGLSLIGIKSYHLSKKRWIEKGVFLGVLGSIFMGATNFFVGFASRITSPLLTNWFIDIFLTLICLIYLLFARKLRKLVKDIKNNKKLLFTVSTLDNGAWVFFAISATLAPIAIVVALSESYIALAVLLGLFINKEKLMTHQKIGLVISFISVIILAILASG
ncbi:MAG: EamA family transporter [Nanoarchaeota archaeon]